MRTLSLAVLLLAVTNVTAADAVITTVVGSGQSTNNGDGGQVLETNVGDPFGVEFGPDVALYVAEVRNHRIRRCDLKTGAVTTIAGTGESGYTGDGGPATKAKLNEPYELRFDSDGHLFVVEMKNHVVRRIDSKTGIITTIAGTGEAGFSGDNGPATKAQLKEPHSIALDGRGRLFIADIGNHRVRAVELKTNVITTFAGNGEKKPPTAGAPIESPLLGPRALYVRDNVLWLALREGHSVWKVVLRDDDKLVWQHVAGTGKRGYSGDGELATEATFDGPKGIAVSASGIVDVVDTENQAIRRIDTKTGRITTLAGSGPKASGFSGDEGPATKAKLARPHGICHGPDGSVYVGDTLNHRVRRIAKAKPPARPSNGAGGKAGVFVKESITVGKLQRAYKLVVPKGVASKTPAPVVFALHGLGDSKELMSFYTQLDRLAERHKFVLVYLDGKHKMWPLIPGLEKDDLAFFDAVYDRVAKDYNVDLNRVYVVGMSNGAYFSHLLARQRSDKIAAIAAHSGGLGAMDKDPKLEHKFGVLLVHGDADSIVKVAESRKGHAAYQKWGHDVEYVEVPSLNHFWAHKVRVNEKIWTFFAAHALDLPLAKAK
jgi:poly(3-hydroxybutyrate) depolymerase/streptogramin lyase